MNENKKKYSVDGIVIIGTDEYRDLLNEKFEAEEWHDKWQEEYCVKSELECECKKLKEELDKLKKFLSKNKALIDEDGVTVFMSLFGEE